MSLNLGQINCAAHPRSHTAKSWQIKQKSFFFRNRVILNRFKRIVWVFVIRLHFLGIYERGAVEIKTATFYTSKEREYNFIVQVVFLRIPSSHPFILFLLRSLIGRLNVQNLGLSILQCLYFVKNMTGVLVRKYLEKDAFKVETFWPFWARSFRQLNIENRLARFCHRLGELASWARFMGRRSNSGLAYLRNLGVI